MDTKKIKNQIEELNKVEENISFSDYKETIKSYVFKKGFEEFNNNRNKKEDFFRLDYVERAVNYAFNTEFESFLGRDYSSLKEKVEFVSKRTEEFGLHLDKNGKILESQTPENKKNMEEYISLSISNIEYIEPDLDLEKYFVKNLLRNEKEKIELEIDEMFLNIQALDFVNKDTETPFFNVNDLKKYVDKNYNENIEYFKQKDEVIKEFIKDEIKNDTTDTIMMNHVITEKMRNLGYKNSYSLDDSDKIDFVLNKDFPNFEYRYKEYKNMLLNEEKEKEKNEKDFER